MNIEKLPSGSYRIRQMIKGQKYTITIPYKPTKKEAAQLIEDRRTGREVLRMTFDAAADKYIEGKRAVLSPSTIRGYSSIKKNLSDSFKNMLLEDMTAWDVQKYINDITPDHTPKTVRNVHGFISAVLMSFAPGISLHTQLPQKQKKDVVLPSDDDINKIIDDVKGSEYEVPFRLACYGLRRSELCALNVEDLDGDVLTINKAIVQDEDYTWHTKTTKTASSTRQVIIDQDLAELIRKQGYIYDGTPDRLYKELRLRQKRLGIAPFPLHMFRHYFASTAHAMGMPDAVIMASGGWKTDHVMKNVYRHEKKSQLEELQRKYAEARGKLWQKHF